MLLRRRSAAALASDETVDFSLDRYQPMGRLMAEEALVFLKSQPGYRAEIGERWKRERRRIFRLYLAELKADFRRLHAHARELVAGSGADSAGLVDVLMKQQVTFLMATTALEFRLALEWIGIGSGFGGLGGRADEAAAHVPDGHHGPGVPSGAAVDRPRTRGHHAADRAGRSDAHGFGATHRATRRIGAGLAQRRRRLQSARKSSFASASCSNSRSAILKSRVWTHLRTPVCSGG